VNDSIEKRLLVYVLAITTIFLLGISIVNYSWARYQVERLSQDKATAIADAATARIESYLLQRGQNAWTLAQNEQIHAFAKKVKSQPVDLEHDSDYQEMMTSFQRIVSLNQDIKFMYVAVAKIDRLFANMEFTYPENYDVTNRPWYQAAAREETLVYTAPYVCPLTAKYVVTASAPFYDEQGNFLGVAAVDIPVERMQKAIEEIHIGSTGYAFMLDENGEPIANPESPYYRKYIKSLKENKSVMDEIKGRMTTGEKGIAEISMRQSNNYLLYSPVSKVGWSVGVIVPVNEIRRDADRLGQFSLVTVIIGMMVISLLITGLTSRITKPIMEFANIMQRAEKGDFTVRATVDSQDEIGMLGNSLNHMLRQQENLIRQVISMANKMGVAGHELAITMSESRTTLPVVTSELSMLIGRSYIQGTDDRDSLENPPNIQLFMEEMIAWNHLCRSVFSQIGALSEAMPSLKNTVSDLPEDFLMSYDIKSLIQKTKDLCKLSESLLIDYIDIYNYVNGVGRNLDDYQNTLQIINQQINSIANIQLDATNRATETAGELVKYSQTLLELASSFHIQKDEDESV